MTIRRLREDEISCLLDLYSHYESTENLPPLSQTDIQGIWREIESNLAVNYFVLELENKIIATCILSITPSFIRGGKAYALIEHVVVHGDFRRRGFAKAMLDFSLNYAWAQGCTEVMLLSGANNFAAHRLYEKLGFDQHRRTGFILHKPQ